MMSLLTYCLSGSPDLVGPEEREDSVIVQAFRGGGNRPTLSAYRFSSCASGAPPPRLWCSWETSVREGPSSMPWSCARLETSPRASSRHVPGPGCSLSGFALLTGSPNTGLREDLLARGSPGVRGLLLKKCPGPRRGTGRVVTECGCEPRPMACRARRCPGSEQPARLVTLP